MYNLYGTLYYMIVPIKIKFLSIFRTFIHELWPGIFNAESSYNQVENTLKSQVVLRQYRAASLVFCVVVVVVVS